MSEGKVHPSADTRQDAASKPLPQLPSQMEIDSQEKKARNTKNLSVNISSGTDYPSPITSFATSPSADALSEPVSPVGLPSQPKLAPRNRFNLSIRTPGLEKTAFLPSTGPSPLVPPTPSTLRRPLVRHFPSEPALSIFSPSAAPHGGMQLPPLGHQGEHRFSERLSQSLHDLKEEEDRSYELPESQEKKENGYPNGPVRIYDCGVYLYLEPSREEASKFDCVINVAKEVLCPFISADSKGKESTITSVMRHGHSEYDRHAISEPQTAVSEFSFKSAFEFQPLESPATPTTPKAEKPEKTDKTAPEYVHIPWDHNSDIVEDAFLLCKIIDKRINDGKKVLVHCQLGVSRSASLIIAYGMFKNSSLDFNKAYENVKSRSQWISPNMSLIYQLTEFRSKLNNGHFEANPRAPPLEWFKFGEAVQTPKAIPAQVVRESESSSSKKSANRSKPLPPIPKFDQANTPSLPSSGPSSTGALTPTPSSVSTATQTDSSPYFPRPLPLRERASAIRPLNLAAVRQEISVEMDLVTNDVPETPSVFSPRAAEFTATPFHRTAAGDLALHMMEPMSPIEVEDPRSPPQLGDASITRSINEFL
jgi:tyrosine-protein phosphatase MSG5